jgi:hypothetical protein
MKWLVSDLNNNEQELHENYEDALKAYNQFVDWNKDVVQEEGWFSGEEHIVLAEVKKTMTSYMTNREIMEVYEGGEETGIGTGEFYWDWCEENLS